MTAVEVCPICDIAGCRHIRERKARMTNDTELDALVKRMDDARYRLSIGIVAVQDVDAIADVREAIRTLRAQLADVQAEVAFMQTCGVIEMMTRNPNINSYVIEWEGRTIRAEAERDAAQAALAAHIEEIGFARLLIDTGWSESDGYRLTYHTNATMKVLDILDKAMAHDSTALDRMLRAEREKALRDAAFVAANACLVEPDGGSPTEEERLVCDEARRRILAMIEQPEIGSGGKP